MKENAASVLLIQELSGGHCEALLELEPQVWARCGKQPVEVHHRLPRSQGGLVLDEAGETYHLLALCNQHHRYAHMEPTKAYQRGLLLQGRVVSGATGPIYVGTDPYLARKYKGNE